MSAEQQKALCFDMEYAESDVVLLVSMVYKQAAMRSRFRLAAPVQSSSHACTLSHAWQPQSCVLHRQALALHVLTSRTDAELQESRDVCTAFTSAGLCRAKERLKPCEILKCNFTNVHLHVGKLLLQVAAVHLEFAAYGSSHELSQRPV